MENLEKYKGLLTKEGYLLPPICDLCNTIYIGWWSKDWKDVPEGLKKLSLCVECTEFMINRKVKVE